jgi:hypothetical protein
MDRVEVEVSANGVKKEEKEEKEIWNDRFYE